MNKTEKEELMVTLHNQIEYLIKELNNIDDRLKSSQLENYNIGEPKNEGTLYKKKKELDNNDLTVLSKGLDLIEHILENNE